MDFTRHIDNELAALSSRGLLRSPRSTEGAQGTHLTMNGQRVLCLCSNNYLGLANHPRILAAVREASDRLGYGAGASRHISGTEATHLRAQERVSRYLLQPAGLLFSTGYAANVGTLQALVGKGDVIFSDELNHASLIDGARLSRARILVYRHGDYEHLEQLLRAHRHEGSAALVVTDSVFSMDGDQADLRRLRDLATAFEAGLVVDEAHAIGLLGPQGRGLCAAQQVVPDVLVAPLGKAFGAAGAISAGAPNTVRLVENRARSFVFSTASPAIQAAAILAATDLVEAAEEQRATLAARSAQLHTGLSNLGYKVPEHPSVILPVHVGPPDLVMDISRELLARQVFVHGIRPPTVPPGTSRLRVTTMATHTEADIQHALGAFSEVRPMLDAADSVKG